MIAIMYLQEALAEAEKAKREWEEIFQAIGHPTLILDAEQSIIHANSATEAATGMPEKDLIGKRCYDIFHHNGGPPKGCPFEKMRTSGHLETAEMELEAPDGTFLVSCTPILDREGRLEKVIHIATDVTERKQAEQERERLEAQLRQAQKMEAIGTLTGGIAHDYNNLLTTIMGNLSLAIEGVGADSDQAGLLNEAHKASAKVRDLTHELMILSSGTAPVRKVGTLQELLEGLSDAVPLESGISLNESIADDLWPVGYDHYKLTSVFQNVVINAVEAMPDGGILTITAENVQIDETQKESVRSLNSGKYVKMTIEDQGVGIPEEYLDRIFDPYFSTKPMGAQKGMGLGLATAYAVVKKHDGHITVNSTPGTGTTVNIYLPATGAESEAPSAERNGTETQSSIDNHSRFQRDLRAAPTKQRILVMDDEEMLRGLAREVLERFGYEAETVKDGQEAIETYTACMTSDEPFDAVILDLTIKGGMGGDEVIKELLKIDPEVKAIVSSGYFNDPVMAEFKSYGFKAALDKPYKMAELKRTLRDILKSRNETIYEKGR